jgi:Ca2+-transporting ATPase
MSTISQEKDGKYIFAKGAPDFLIKYCTSYLNAEGKPTPITEQFKATLNAKLKEFADATLRTILLAYRDASKESESSPVE